MKKVTIPSGEEILIESLLGMHNGAVERQEARGQASFVGSDTLPTDMGPGARGHATRKALEAAGVAFGEKVPGDEIFTYATLPKGWTKRATDHAMHSDLVDERGRVRASIFYKAAFYDRRAHIHATCRFRVDTYAGTEASPRAVVRDGDVVIHEIPYPPYPEGRDREKVEARYKALDAAEQACVAWISEQRPSWRDPAAYWSEPEEGKR